MTKTPARLLTVLLSGVATLTGPSLTSQDVEPPEKRIQSEVRRTDAGERILVQEVWVEAPVAEVWAAYTTDEGWTSWAVPKAEVDLRAGGAIRTAYGDVELGEPGTITMQVVNYVPNEVLTLKADVSERWPEVMKQDADHLMNVILFDSMSEQWTRIRSFGVGYGDSPEYENLMGFFVSANEGLFANLTRYLEKGEAQRWGK